MFNGIPECRGLSDSSTVTVQPVAQRTPPDIYSGHQYILFMAMAFKSVSEFHSVLHFICDPALQKPFMFTYFT